MTQRTQSHPLIKYSRDQVSIGVEISEKTWSQSQRPTLVYLVSVDIKNITETWSLALQRDLVSVVQRDQVSLYTGDSEKSGENFIENYLSKNVCEIKEFKIE